MAADHKLRHEVLLSVGPVQLPRWPSREASPAYLITCCDGRNHALFILSYPQGWISVPEGKREYVQAESSEESLPNAVMLIMLWVELSGEIGDNAAPEQQRSLPSVLLGREQKPLPENSEESCVGKISFQELWPLWEECHAANPEILSREGNQGLNTQPLLFCHVLFGTKSHRALEPPGGAHGNQLPGAESRGEKSGEWFLRHELKIFGTNR